MKHYIFRWKSGGIYVTSSRRETEEEVWDFAITWLRPAGLTDDKQSERIIREEGEVVLDDES